MKHINGIINQLQQMTGKLSNVKYDQANPWSSLSEMQKMLDQSFWDNLQQLNSNMNNNDEIDVPSPAEDTSAWSPAADTIETLSKVIVCVEIPGLDRNSLHLSILNHREVVIKGAVKEHDFSEFLVIKERKHGRFTRRIQLPSSVDTRGTKTIYKDGLLELHMQKKQGSIKSNSAASHSEIVVDLL